MFEGKAAQVWNFADMVKAGLRQFHWRIMFGSAFFATTKPLLQLNTTWVDDEDTVVSLNPPNGQWSFIQHNLANYLTS